MSVFTSLFTSIFSSSPTEVMVYSHTVDHRPSGGVIRVINPDSVQIPEDKHFYPHHCYTESDYDTYCASCTDSDGVVVYNEPIDVIYDEKDEIYFINDGRHRVRAAQKAKKKLQVRVIETRVYTTQDKRHKETNLF